MTSKLADEYSDINKRLEEIQAERQAHIMGKPIEGEPTEAPKDIDWSGVFGYQGITGPTTFTQYKLTDTIESVLPDFRDFIG